MRTSLINKIDTEDGACAHRGKHGSLRCPESNLAFAKDWRVLGVLFTSTVLLYAYIDAIFAIEVILGQTSIPHLEIPERYPVK